MEKAERKTYSIQEVAKIFGIGRTTAYTMAKSGEIPAIRFRSRVVVPAAWVEAQLKIGTEEKQEKADTR